MPSLPSPTAQLLEALRALDTGAARREWEPKVVTALAQGADPNVGLAASSTEDEEWSGFSLAAQVWYRRTTTALSVATLTQLLDAGLHVPVTASHLETLVDGGLLPAAELLLRRGVLPTLKVESLLHLVLPLWTMAWHPEVSSLWEALVERLPPASWANCRNTQGASLLFFLDRLPYETTQEQAGQWLDRCLALGVPLEAPDATGSTPLLKTRFKIAFLQRGANPTAANHQGMTALHEAAARHQTENITALLAQGADPNAQDHQGRTPLHASVRLPSTQAILPNEPPTLHLPSVTHLVAAGADLHCVNQEGQSAWQIAQVERQPLEVRQALEALALAQQLRESLQPKSSGVSRPRF